MPRDYKSIWNEAYNSAIEGGKTEEQAVKIAEEAVIDYESSMIDEAMNVLKSSKNR